MQRGYEKVTIFDQYLTLSRKWCKIQPQLQWKANPIKLLMVPVWRFQGHDIIQRQITQKRYKIDCNGGPIESRIWSIERRHFQWPWTTPTPGFKVTPLFDAEYLRNGARYNTQFQWNTNRDLHTHRVLNGVISNDLDSCYIWYSEEEPGRAGAPPSPILARCTKCNSHAPINGQCTNFILFDVTI